MVRLDRNYGDMVARLNGTYQLPADSEQGPSSTANRAHDQRPTKPGTDLGS